MMASLSLEMKRWTRASRNRRAIGLNASYVSPKPTRVAAAEVLDAVPPGRLRPQRLADGLVAGELGGRDSAMTSQDRPTPPLSR